jgi:hypothetical protein
LSLRKDTANPLENRPENFEFMRRILTQPQRTCLSGSGDHIAIVVPHLNCGQVA